MSDEQLVYSWILKPCSDGVSIDVRPPHRYQLHLLSLNTNLPKFYTSQVVTPSLAILYDPKKIKVTLYQSGRMLIETRNMEIAKEITKNLLEFFNYEQNEK